MQELLVTADILVTDFSSTMFEFSLLKKPCFLVASDLYSYDRNLYFPLDKLPYKKYSDIYELAKELPKISINEYIKEQSSFVNKVFSPIYDPNTSEKLTNWLLINSNK
jgi:CDP-glycerol glycerophosphotransferase